ncbi:MAG: hypothetical protein ACOC4J_05895 [Bacteroidota bacterium]
MKLAFLIAVILTVCPPLAGQSFYPEKAKRQKIELVGGYGYFSLREVKDAYLYERTESTGLIWGGIKFNPAPKFSLILTGGYEKTTLFPKGVVENDSLFISSWLALAKLNYTYYQQNRFELYISAATGLHYLNYNTLSESNTEFKFAEELILLGIRYEWELLCLYLEFGKSDLALCKAGMGIKL